MALPKLSQMKPEITIAPQLMLVYGVAGIGKTTFASEAPNPLFLCCEKRGANTILATKYIIDDYDTLMEALDNAENEEHDLKTLVIDTIDKCEDILLEQLLKEYNQRHRSSYQTINDIPNGTGWTLIEKRWKDLTDRLIAISDKRRMNIMLIGHSDTKEINDLHLGTYSRYDLRISKKSANYLVGWADLVLYATRDSSVQLNTEKKTLGSKNIEIKGDRVIYTNDDHHCRAKNRFSLPGQMPLNYASLANAMKDYLMRKRSQAEALQEKSTPVSSSNSTVVSKMETVESLAPVEAVVAKSATAAKRTPFMEQVNPQ